MHSGHVSSSLLKYTKHCLISFHSRHNLPTIDFAGSNEGYAYESENEVEGEAISQQVRECWKLGTGPLKDFRYTIEANGIVVTCTDQKQIKLMHLVNVPLLTAVVF